MGEGAGGGGWDRKAEAEAKLAELKRARAEKTGVKGGGGESTSSVRVQDDLDLTDFTPVGYAHAVSFTVDKFKVALTSGVMRLNLAIPATPALVASCMALEAAGDGFEWHLAVFAPEHVVEAAVAMGATPPLS
jgi:hypothetical protein